MSTFLNRFLWDDNQRLMVQEAGASMFHDGLAYDTDGQLYVSYASSARFFLAGIGFADDGAMLVVDASGGLPADTAWQSGMPVSAAQSRLCVAPGGTVAYVHQGVSFTAGGAVAVTGVAPPGESDVLAEDGLNIITEDGLFNVIQG